jgi:hypothetical protein
MSNLGVSVGRGGDRQFLVPKDARCIVDRRFFVAQSKVKILGAVQQQRALKRIV